MNVSRLAHRLFDCAVSTDLKSLLFGPWSSSREGRLQRRLQMFTLPTILYALYNPTCIFVKSLAARSHYDVYPGPDATVITSS